MAFCYHCGEEIEFINNGFGPIPIHPSGSCSGRAGGYGGGGGSAFRSTSDGEVFEFPFITYPSYINPNARCPVCGASVYFYQSPYGGRVFFDELGPPWPKHPCTDNPIVRHHFSSADGRARILATVARSDSETILCETTALDSQSTGALRHPVAAWTKAGWMPFVVTKIIPRLIGIEVEGKLFMSDGNNSVLFRISQASNDAKLYRARGHLQIGCSLVQNTSPILTALNECPILLKMDPDLARLTLSSFILNRDGEVDEITLSVLGTEWNE
ncbi:MAG TPA: hypothetical protein VH595_17075 [Verrucomicrobiae bacterium]|jgi:hypothetical protein|nr:hypothetical protein [Verrucomicrobiae bacterium]